MTTTTLCVRRLLPLLLRLLQPQGRRAAAIGPRAVRWFCPSAPSSCVAEQLARAACSLLAIAHLSDAARLHLLPQAIVVAALLVLFACIPTIGPNTHDSPFALPHTPSCCTVVSRTSSTAQRARSSSTGQRAGEQSCVEAGGGGREAPRKGANEIRNSARIDPTSCPLQLCAATQNMPPGRGERRNQERQQIMSSEVHSVRVMLSELH